MSYKRLFTTAASQTRAFIKLGAKQNRLFKTFMIVDLSDTQLQHPDNIRTFLVAHSKHTVREERQPPDISRPQAEQSRSPIDKTGDLVIVI